MTPYPTATSKLPQGGPLQKGLSLSDGVGGVLLHTHAKPEDDVREPVVEDASMYRNEDANSRSKSQTVPDEVDHSQAKPSYFGLVDQHGEPFDTGKTKYPYRDHKRNINSMLYERVARQHRQGVGSTAQKADTGGACPSDEGAPVKVAYSEENIFKMLKPDVVARARTCTVQLKSTLAGGARHVYTVTCGSGPKIVNVVRTSSHVQVSCTCEDWVYGGPEYFAARMGYLFGRPRGTLEEPTDKRALNRLCKHAAAALLYARAQTEPESAPTES